MPVTLLSAKIRGIRSYSPSEELSQVVDFMPLTLIIGSNGTGKTTLIESLKFIISGEEPPHSDSRRNFIHTSKTDNKFSGTSAAYASIEIQFLNSSGELCIAKRDISRANTCGKNATPTITSSYKIGKNTWVTVHRQDDWNKLLPKLFGLPNQAILSNVILCHQEDNLWCMGESSSVKQIFDKIFGCEQYKKEVRFIDDEIRISKKDLLMSEKDLQHFGEKVKRKKVIKGEVNNLTMELAKIESKTKILETEIMELSERKRIISEQISQLETKSREISSLRQRANELKERDSLLRRSLQPIVNRRVEYPPIKKKQAPDPTASDLGFVIENLEKMSLIIDELPPSSNVDSLKSLVKSSIGKIESIRNRFTTPTIEETPEVDEKKEQENSYRDAIESSIHDNIKQLDSIKAQINVIEQEIKDDDKLNQAKVELKETELKLIAVRDKRSQMAGARCQIERELGRIKSELNDHKKANINYAESLGKFVCNKIIISDLEKLKQCFQESITNFHDQMIIKINEVLRSRWRQVYQGSDIDYVELVDEEITRGKDKKSYNYHMAMHKGGIKMRMREKSSAGQRALASIILRMTLAELFVKDFAFIALDEPTANLDLANVHALARAIGSYVQKRTKKGANIQWIIITHDEQFLRALDEECSPFFYRTQMNQDGYSRIVKISYHDAEKLTQ